MALGRRRNKSPDTRLDWRDPKMPCLRFYLEEDEDGFITDKLNLEVVKPKVVTIVAHEDLRVVNEEEHPTYRKDPSYFWAKPGARRQR